MSKLSEHYLRQFESFLKETMNKKFDEYEILFDTDCIFIVPDNKDTIEEKARKIKEDIKKETEKSKSKVHKKPIIIKTEKVVADGEKKIKILSFENVQSKISLPTSYIQNKEDYVCKDEGYLILSPNVFKRTDINRSVFKIGDVVSESVFINLIAYIKKCGKRLHDINKQIEEKNAKLKDEWKGTETFTI